MPLFVIHGTDAFPKATVSNHPLVEAQLQFYVDAVATSLGNDFVKTKHRTMPMGELGCGDKVGGIGKGPFFHP